MDKKFLLIARFRPCHKARAFDLLFVSWPRPHEKCSSVEPPGLKITPPPPIAPELPLEAPSKKRK